MRPLAECNSPPARGWPSGSPAHPHAVPTAAVPTTPGVAHQSNGSTAAVLEAATSTPQSRAHDNFGAVPDAERDEAREEGGWATIASDGLGVGNHRWAQMSGPAGRFSPSNTQGALLRDQMLRSELLVSTLDAAHREASQHAATSANEPTAPATAPLTAAVRPNPDGLNAYYREVEIAYANAVLDSRNGSCWQ